MTDICNENFSVSNAEAIKSLINIQKSIIWFLCKSKNEAGNSSQQQNEAIIRLKFTQTLRKELYRQRMTDHKQAMPLKRKCHRNVSGILFKLTKRTTIANRKTYTQNNNRTSTTTTMR